MAPHSSTLAWKIPWTEEPGRLQSTGSLRVGDDWATSLSLFTFMHWRRKWPPTPVFLPGENPRDGVAQSRTRLKWLSNSSSSSTYKYITIWIFKKPALLFLLFMHTCVSHIRPKDLEFVRDPSSRPCVLAKVAFSCDLRKNLYYRYQYLSLCIVIIHFWVHFFNPLDLRFLEHENHVCISSTQP